MTDEVRRFLEVRDIVTGYGKKQVLNGVGINVAQGEIVALIGHNGAGKSTLLKAIFGLLPIWKGQVIYDGNELYSLNPRGLLNLGIAFVPQGNHVFTDLTVRENIKVGGVTLPNKNQLNEGIERGLKLFPALKPRLHQRAGTLSGGEKQMLALATALVLSPRMLLLDEPSLGLAPGLVNVAFEHIQKISNNFGLSVLIVEQKVRKVLSIAQRVYVLRNGLVSFDGTSDSLKDEERLKEVYL